MQEETLLVSCHALHVGLRVQFAASRWQAGGEQAGSDRYRKRRENVGGRVRFVWRAPPALVSLSCRSSSKRRWLRDRNRRSRIYQRIALL